MGTALGSEQNAAADGAFDLLQLGLGKVGVLGVDVDDHVTDFLVGLQELTGDVDAVLGEDLVDLAEHARDVLVDVQQAMLAGVSRQGHFREVDRRYRRTVVAVLDQLFCDFQTDVGLRFGSGTADVRGQDHVVQATQRAFEDVVVRAWLDREHVDCSADQVLVLDRVGQGVQFNDCAASRVDQDAALFHRANFFFADHPLGFRGFRHVQGNDIGHAQQLVQAGHLSRVAQWQLGQRVVEVHLHAQAFGQHRQLRTNRAIANDAELLATDFERVGRAFDPAATVAGSVLLRDTAQQQDRLGQHQFCYRAGVGVGRIEHCNTALTRCIEVNLVGADAEAADGNQFLGAIEQLFGQLSAGADTDEVCVGDLFFQFGFRQRLGVVLDAGVAGCLEDVDSGLMDAFEKKELDLALVEGSLAHLRKPVSRRKLAGGARFGSGHDSRGAYASI
ncbi:Uncharacterized protein ALO61_05256 [Pseudomonas savastanoi pv. nerii]|nr:Uncharacterized protein ALO61_05256 [Pseudomonas savastanoi pv. nerii]KUG45331.1 Uncharacterized protein ALP79_05529 [Pseudomonas savastanoi pv. fraxini]RMR71789.1 hypothetical protein ALP80_05508 [Pseudomonas savastanoi pv. fraxini]